MTVVRWAGDMVKGLWTVVVGMNITMRHMFQTPVTMHYPDEKWVMPETYRGLLKVDMNACIVCDLCMKACPVDCIDIEWKREEGKAGKVATRFQIDYQKCMYCGLCVAPCPTDAIWHTHEYENASYNRVAQVIDWVHPENTAGCGGPVGIQMERGGGRSGCAVGAQHGVPVGGKEPGFCRAGARACAGKHVHL